MVLFQIRDLFSDLTQNKIPTSQIKGFPILMDNEWREEFHRASLVILDILGK